MSELIVTSVGDIEVDLHTSQCPLTTTNFLKLCKAKYYNGCLFHTVHKGFIAQTGDHHQARFFDDEILPELRHSKTGTVAMAGGGSGGKNRNASQFYITLRDGIDYLDGKHTVFGVVAEGFDTLARISEAYVDGNGRPFKDIRIKHTYVLDDPFDDPPELARLTPENSPTGKPRDEFAEERLGDTHVFPSDDETVAGGKQQLEEMIRAREARTNAALLEGLGDIPDADMEPPENVSFVCRLNPVTQDEDLHIIFSRCGTVASAEVVRDCRTGDSLCYAFIEFETKEACARAFETMDGCLVDDRRIKVDFSQSASSKDEWGRFRRGRRSAKRGDWLRCGSPDYYPNTKDHETGHRNKIQKVADQRSGLVTHSRHSDDKRSRRAVIKKTT